MVSRGHIFQNKLLYPEILWERPVRLYNAAAGRVLVLAGSRGHENIALLTCEAIFQSGTGILTLGYPEELRGAYSGILPEEMTLALPQTHSGSLAKKAKEDILRQSAAVGLCLLGPGISTNTETVQLIWELLPLLQKPLIITGEGLNALAYGIEVIRGKEGTEGVKQYFSKITLNITLIGDPGTFSHIATALGIERRQATQSFFSSHPVEALENILAHLRTRLVLISHKITIVTDKKIIEDRSGGELYTNPELLAGMAASFIVQNKRKPFKALSTAAYLYARASHWAKSENPGREIVASDLTRAIPAIIRMEENTSDATPLA